jgi:hypothetical protein
MYKKFLLYFLLTLFFFASTTLTACGGVQAPEPIDWSSSDDAPTFGEADGGGDIIEGGGVSDTHERDNTGSAPPDDSPSSEYNPNNPPPKIDLPSVWREFTNAPIQNQAGNRSVDAYLAVLKQFGVDNSPCRYTPSAACGGPTDTRCNIYASDVMNAMGAHLPTKGELGVGHGTSKTTDPMPANARDTHAWLNQQKDGWRKLDPNNPNDWATLQAHVAAGKPALASRSDHIAVIRPDQPGGLATGNTDSLKIAQSGAINSSNTTIGTAFTGATPDIYIHE